MGVFGGTSQSISTSAQQIGALRIQSSAYGLPCPIVWGRTRITANLLWYGNFIATAHVAEQSSGGKGGDVTTTNTTYTYSAGVALALCEGPIASIDKVWATKKLSSLSALGLTTFKGNYPQSQWGFLNAYRPNQSLRYNGLAYVANGSYNLGDSAQLPNHSFEVTGRLSYGASSALKVFTATAPTISGAKNFVVDFSTSIPSMASVNIITTFSGNFNSPAHGYVNGNILRMTASPFPGNFAAGIDYYVVNAGTDSYQLSATLGGVPIIPTSKASGTTNKRVYNNQLNSTAHGFTEDTPLRVSTSGTLPSPLVVNTYYYAKSVTTNALSLAASKGGAAINIQGAGSGVHNLFTYQVQANPKDIVNDFLTNINFGANFPSANCDSWLQYSNYCIANNLFLSPALTEQVPAQEFITNELLLATNSQALWSENLLKIAPYGDQVVSGNGVTYTPITAPQYSLDSDDFIVGDGEDPIIVIRKTQADAYNQVQVEFIDSNSQYNISIAEAKDQSNIEKFGLRPMPVVKLHSILTSDIATFVAYALLNRALYIRNQYQFTVGWKYCLLEPIIDFVSLTDPELGLNNTPVRIISITEDSENDLLQIVAEEVPGGISQPSIEDGASTDGYVADYNVAPGSIQTPQFVNAPGRLTVTGYEVWIGLASTSPSWGGCQIWISYDNASYQRVGVQYGESRFGYLTADLDVGTDPDTVNTLSVDMSLSLAELHTASQIDVDNLVTLFLVDQEIMAYRDATLTGPYQYDLTYLRRGCYGSTITAHTAGSPMTRLDDQCFKAAIDATTVNQQLYFKFPSFNTYGQGLEDMSTLPAYAFTPTGSTSYPADILNFFAAQNGSAVLFQWQFDDAPNIAGYEIRFNPIGNTSWMDATPVTKVTRGTQITTVKVPPGNWTFLACATDTSARYSVNPARYDLGVASDLTMLMTRDETLTWEQGILTNYIIDGWNRNLVPVSLSLMNAWTDWTAWDSAIPNPSSNQAYESPEMDLGIDVFIRAYGEVYSRILPDTAGAANTDAFIDFKTSSGSYDGYKAWGIGTFLARYVKQKFTADTVIGLQSIYGFNPSIDANKREEEAASVSVDVGGTTITFSTPFYYQPVITTQLQGGVAGSAIVTAQNTTGFTVKVFNTAGTDVGGLINWNAKGV